MKLIATPLSHFARKVRFLMDHFHIPYEFVDAGNVATISLENFGNNPLLKVPTLIDGETWLIESDHIAAYLVEKFDPQDSLQVLSKEVFDLNARAVMNGIMSEEVKILLAKRTQVPVENYSFFDKSFLSITYGLAWLEKHHQHFDSENPKYRDIHLVCLWEHIEYYNLVPLNDYKSLEKLVRRINNFSTLMSLSPRVQKPK